MLAAFSLTTARDKSWWNHCRSQEQGHNEVRWRPGQEASLAAPCSNLRSFGSQCTALKKVLATLSGLFGTPILIRHPVHCAPLDPPGYAPAQESLDISTSFFVRSLKNGAVDFPGTLVVSIVTVNLEFTAKLTTVNLELCKIDHWLRANKLSLNYNKTNFMLLTSRKHNPA